MNEWRKYTQPENWHPAAKGAAGPDRVPGVTVTLCGILCRDRSPFGGVKKRIAADLQIYDAMRKN